MCYIFVSEDLLPPPPLQHFNFIRQILCLPEKFSSLTVSADSLFIHNAIKPFSVIDEAFRGQACDLCLTGLVRLCIDVD